MREKKPINIRVGANIQKVREERHYTQEDLSEKVGVTPNHLSAIERGVSGVSLELLEKLCEALEVSSDRLLFGSDVVEMKMQEFESLMKEISQAQRNLVKDLQNLTELLK